MRDRSLTRMERNHRTLRALLPALAVAAFFSTHNALARDGDHDPVTGEPNCVKCHTPDRRYSIDYTRDDTCSECHGPGLSPRYVEIDGRYKGHAGADGETLSYAEYARAGGAAGGETFSYSFEAKAQAPAPPKAKAPKGMVLVPGGEFVMGSNDWWPKSQPEHKRDIPAFYIDKYEVTNKRYKAFVDATGATPPNHWPGGKVPPGREDHPVVFVSWHDADAFCKWEGKRLPREEEWEKAARGTDGRTFPWGNKFEKEWANTPQYSHGDTLPVGSFEKGKSPYGAYDLAGNVWEWTADWFKPYPGNTHYDENYGERYRVLRGGSWYDCTYYKCGISAPAYNRVFFQPNTRNNNFGFRCAKDK